MAKKTTTTADAEKFVPDSIVEVQDEYNAKSTAVTFSPEQMEVINKLIASSKVTSSSPESISVYNVRDKKKIETVNVSRFDGKFVIGFKDVNNDPYNPTPKYYTEKLDVVRKLPNQPFVTLILSDGKETEEKEVSLVDYLNYRKKFKANLVHIDSKEVINDHGLLGRINKDLGSMIDEKGNPIQSTAIRAESKQLVRKFYVELPGFDKPVEFIEDFLA